MWHKLNITPSREFKTPDVNFQDDIIRISLYGSHIEHRKKDQIRFVIGVKTLQRAGWTIGNSISFFISETGEYGIGISDHGPTLRKHEGKSKSFSGCAVVETVVQLNSLQLVVNKDNLTRIFKNPTFKNGVIELPKLAENEQPKR